ncbi:MAG: hypothetical protein MZV70_21485 [Desulfobacterales bacterium]|nr:hypothetical protein [Desulfobacterales bacterium]
MPQNLNSAQEYAQKWLEIIKKPEQPPEELGKWIIEESMHNFAEHFNKGWLDYRKSVTQAGQWAATEWTGTRRNLRRCAGTQISLTSWAASA